MKASWPVIASATLDFFFAHVDELYTDKTQQFQWYVWDFATFYRVGCLAVLLIVFAGRLTFNKPLHIKPWAFWIYIGYWIFALLEYYMFTLTQYNERVVSAP